MEYYPRARLHTSTYSVESSDSQFESNLDQHQEITSDVSADSCSIYLLSDPPSALPALAAPHPNTRSTHAALPPPGPPLSRLKPRDESENRSTGAIPGSSTDVTHDWECVRPVRRLSANTDTNGDSNSSIEEWDCTGCTPHETTLLDESESSALDEDALHAHRWDLIPEYPPLGVSRDTLFLRMHGRPLELRRPPPERSPSRPATPTLTPAPHPRIRLPLLSVFAPLLSIDDATLHLIAHSPAHSALFPGPIHPPDERTGNTQGIHGILALLGPSRSYAALRDGLAVACDESILPSSPFQISVSPLVGLLGLVKGIWAGGRAALREVYG